VPPEYPTGRFPLGRGEIYFTAVQKLPTVGVLIESTIARLRAVRLSIPPVEIF